MLIRPREAETGEAETEDRPNLASRSGGALLTRVALVSPQESRYRQHHTKPALVPSKSMPLHFNSSLLHTQPVFFIILNPRPVDDCSSLYSISNVAPAFHASRLVLPPRKLPLHTSPQYYNWRFATRYPSSAIMPAANFLQLQTRAAFPQTASASRPSSPSQNALLTASSPGKTNHSLSTTSSRQPSSERSPAPSVIHCARCSRCQRSVSSHEDVPGINGVSFGLNSYYCNRCAKAVGYV